MSLSNKRPGIAPRYAVRLFGALYVENLSNLAHPVTIPAGRPQSLLGYLLLRRGRPIDRAQVTATLWPGVDENRARRALSDTLYRLRKALEEEWIRMEGTMLAVSPDLDLTVDVWDFEDAIHQGTPDALAKAISLYQGELLAGLDEEWLLASRLAFHESYLNALEALARQAEEKRDLGRAALYYHQLIQAEPYREAGYVGLMRVLASRRPQEALQIYERLAQILTEELNAAPSVYAQELAAQLRAEAELLAAPVETAAPLHRLPFVGRLAQRALALQQIQGLGRGRGGVLLVEAESGMGKTRLLEHLVESATWRSVMTLRIHFSADRDANPYGPLAEALQDVWNSSRGPQLAARLAPEEMAALGPLAPEWIHRPATLLRPSAEAHSLLGYAWVALLRELSDLGPCLLAFDDVHRATPSIWDLLAALLPHLSELPCLLLLAYRRSELEKQPVWSLLQSWEAQATLRRVELTPLDQEDVARLLPTDVDLDAAEVHALTGGNPLYIQQLLLSERGVAQNPAQILRARLDNLPPAARQALDAAAVLGETISLALWRDLLHASYGHLTAVADILVAQNWLTVQGHHYRFAHDLLRDAVLAELSDQTRRSYHSRAADLLQEDPALGSIYALAHHLDQAGRNVEAARTYLTVGQDAQALHAYAEARDAYRRGLSLLDAGAEELQLALLRALAQVLPVTGDWEEQESVLGQLESLARSGGDPLLQKEVTIYQAELAFQAGRYDEALQLLDRAGAGVARDQQTDLRIELLRGDIFLRVNQYDSARLHLEEARILALALGRRAEEGRALDGLAWVGCQQGEDTETVLALYRQALEAQQAAGDRLGEARTLLNLVTAQSNAGLWDQVIELADDVLAAQRKVQYRLGEAVTQQTLATTYIALGLYEKAMEHVGQALTGFRAVNEQAGAVIALETRGNIAARLGELAQAETDLREALGLATTLEIPVFVAFAQQDLGTLLYEMGRGQEAIPLLEQARTTWADLGDSLNRVRCEALLGLAYLAQDDVAQARGLAEAGWRVFLEEPPSGEDRQGWLWWLAQLWLQLGQEERGRQLIREAYLELQRQAVRIHKGHLRASFFHQAVYNRAIVALYDRLHGIQRTVQVTLSPANSPGSPRPVTLTLSGPEDEAIVAAGARRRFVLARLMREAQAQGVRPTDAELAQILNVSRRTVIRDRKQMEDLKTED